MRRRIIIILFGMAIVIALCGLLPLALVMLLPRVAPNPTTHDRERIKKIAHEIANYTLPEGIEESEGTDIGVIKEVWFYSYADRVRIYFFYVSLPAFTKDLTNDRPEIIAPSEAECEDSSIRNMSYRSISLRGEPTTFLLWDCRNEIGPVRYARHISGVKVGLLM